MGCAIIVVALFVFLVVFLAGQDPALLIDILSAVAIFGGGFGAGYGLKTWTNKASD